MSETLGLPLSSLLAIALLLGISASAAGLLLFYALVKAAVRQGTIEATMQLERDAER